MPDSLILRERRDGVLRLTLNRPDVLNALTFEMARELQDALDEAAGDAAVRAVLLTGAGRGFCAGQDLGAVVLEEGQPLPDVGDFVREQYNPIVRKLRELPKPVVAAVNGVAAGAGANIALACDLVVAAAEASFIQSFAKIGLIPDSGGTFFLPRLVGFARATALTMLGEKVSATQARDWGMIWEVVPGTALADRAQAIAAQLATQPTRAFALTKRALNASMTNDVVAQLEVEEALQREAGRSEDFREGVQAFLAKRKPAFTGR
jgi:2-(1,2-epoxy-1,2-dihydrophenyl)acetyl-CoA isomerase